MNNNNYKIIRTIYENVFQRVLECKYDDSNEIFYNNVITSQKVINLINIEGLNNIATNILECNRTEDRIYIITKQLEFESKNIKEYIKNNKLTLKQQFALTKNIIELSSDIYNMTDIVQQKILDLDKIYIDNAGKIIVDCNLVFEQEYDISDNETFKRMGNIIHFIFSGSEIVDYNISELVPPDILKIIVRCLTKEYMYPKNALTELTASPIYKMITSDDININGKDEKLKKDINSSRIAVENVEKVVNEKNKDKTLREKLVNLNIENDDKINGNKGIYDIYLNDNNDSDRKSIKKNKRKSIINNDIKKIVLSLILVVIILFLGRYLISKFTNDAKPVSGDEINTAEIDNNKENNGADSNTAEGTIVNGNDSTNKFFNSDLIAKINYTGTAAELDKDIYVEGDSSLLIKNEGDEKVRALFATVDFTDPNYSYMLKQQIGVSGKIKSEEDLSALIVFEAYKDGKLASTFHTKIQIYNDMWSQYMVPINVTNADYLNIYVEYSGKNKVWVDSTYIDVIK